MTQAFKPALVRRDVDMELFSLPINLVFHQHIMSDQVWARGSKVISIFSRLDEIVD